VRHIELLIDVAANYYREGRHVSTALPIIERAIVLAECLRLDTQLRRALSIQGLIYGATWNTAGALRSLVSALELATRMDDVAGAASAWINIAITLCEATLFSDAYACFNRADLLALSTPGESLRSKMRCRTLHGMALCDLYLHKRERAIQACESALEYCVDPVDEEDAQLRALVEATYAHLLLDLGQDAEAEKHLRDAEELAARSGAVRAEISTGMVRALLQVSKGGATELDKVVQLRTLAKSLPGSQLELLRISVDIYERAGKLDAAIDCLHEISVLNEQLAGQLLEADRADLERLLGCSVEDDVGSRIAKESELEVALQSQLETITNTAITTAIRSGYDQYRIFRLGKLARLFALEQGWEFGRAEGLALSARLCDIGMVGVPDWLLRKERALLAGERRIVEDHVRVGPELLRQTGLTILQPCVQAARFHHERWDGRGPWGLVGGAIPVEARIIALCDSLDSLTHARPWRRQKTLPSALRDIERDLGGRFDPALGEQFVSFIRHLYWASDDFEILLAEDAVDNSYMRIREQIGKLIADSKDA
jgi:tetratricopeptide (TPR) repeat protein